MCSAPAQTGFLELSETSKETLWVRSVHLEVNSRADGGEPLCGLLDFHSVLSLESWRSGTPSHVKLFFLLVSAELGGRLVWSPQFALTCQITRLAVPPPGMLN